MDQVIIKEYTLENHMNRCLCCLKKFEVDSTSNKTNWKTVLWFHTDWGKQNNNIYFSILSITNNLLINQAEKQWKILKHNLHHLQKRSYLLKWLEKIVYC